MKLQKKSWPGEEGDVYVFWCPGCECRHTYNVGRSKRPCWQFNGNMDAPTFTPSLLYPDIVCHLFLTDGRLQFLGDCTHALAGQTVDLPDFPEDMLL